MKLCKDCRFYIGQYCTRPTGGNSPVSGKPYTLSEAAGTERTSYGIFIDWSRDYCGPKGKYWEMK